MCEYTGRVNEDKQICTGACMCVKAKILNWEGTWFPKVDVAIWPQESFDF